MQHVTLFDRIISIGYYVKTDLLDFDRISKPT